MPPGSPSYDRIGIQYTATRRPDPRIERRLHGALAGADSVINVGAGAGSYEPSDRLVVAVEPSLTMIGQRPPSTAAVVQAGAEALPFAAGAFAAAMAVLTIHHWTDWRMGLREMRRVSRQRVVLFTWDPAPAASAAFWLRDYLPDDLVQADSRRFPALDQVAEALGGADVFPVPIPFDCSDGFMGAYWRRPAFYLESSIRRGISSLADARPAQPWQQRLSADLDSGVWERKYAHLLARAELDVGYRIVIAGTGGVASVW